MNDPLPDHEAATARRWELPLLGAGGAKGRPPTARDVDDAGTAAREEGLAQGRREGYAAGLQEAHELAGRLRSLLESFSRPLEHLDAEVERGLVALALQLARELALRELRTDPAAVAALVREAVKAITPPPRHVRVHLHPEDAAAVRGLLAGATSGAHCELIVDDQLHQGDCRVTADASTVNGRMDARVAELAQALLGEGA